MCTCQYHVDQRRWERLLEKAPLSVGDKRFVSAYFERKTCEELDAEVDAAVLSGQWPSAVEQLRFALRKAIKLRRETQERENAKTKEIS